MNPMTNEMKAPDDLAGELVRLAETIEGGGPHEWGFRDITTGKFMHDDWPFEVAGHLPAILAVLTTNDALIAENELLREKAWREGYCAGAYRPDWKGPLTGDQITAAWEDNLARAALTAGGSHAD